jgi:tetratricopeptide (TPR) repeat protein
VKNVKKIVFVFVVFTMLYACSTKKDTLVSRNYHTLTTKYNVLFNGKKALNVGIEAINNSFDDNYFKQLLIEPIEFDDDRIIIPKISYSLGDGFGGNKKAQVSSSEKGKNNSTPFDVAEEKAVKAIQKHSMDINGYQRNRQIDEAYLLLGKSRYYSQRFIPAIEAFNYVIVNYPNSNLVADTKIWRAKTNVRLDNEEFAIESLSLLLVVRDSLEADLPDLVKEKAHTAMAMAYLKSDSLQKVKKHLAFATRTFKGKDQAARNLFILGQIYSQENKKDSATMVFQKLTRFKKAPYRFRIHAEIEIAKNSANDSSAVPVLKKIQSLIKDRDNKPYLDRLYYQEAVLHRNNDSIKLAINSFNNSIQAKKGSEKQQSFSYEKLASIYFKNSKYQLASSYFDSVLKVDSDSLNLRYRRIKRKHKNLASLIKFEELVSENDSIINIASLSTSEQEIFFQKYINTIKKEDEKAAQLKLNQLAFGGDFGANSLQSSKKGSWYFYNSQSLNFGKTEFQKIWGTRKLADNWRWSSSIDFSNSNVDSVQTVQKNLRYDLASYLENIPTKKTTIDGLKIARNTALYELGIIYKEQFKDIPLAINRLESVASLNTDEALTLPINWHLYQIYTNLNAIEKANKHAELILTKYPKTVFAQKIKSPDKTFKQEDKVDEIANTYKEIFYIYKENKFEETLAKIDAILPTIQNSKLLPKFALLKAYAIGKYKNKETYKNALEFISVNYANTEEGKKAREIINQLNK